MTSNNYKVLSSKYNCNIRLFRRFNKPLLSANRAVESRCALCIFYINMQHL